MNVLRLLLSVCIVVFHNSGILGTVGYSAVFGFFLMSGYANTAAISKKYKNNVVRYWLNRLLRIMPTYLVMLLLQFLVRALFGRYVVINGEQIELFANSLENYNAIDVFHEITLGIFQRKGCGWSLAFSGFPTMVTQAWSDTIEFSFYVCAPFFVWIFQKRRNVFHILFIISFVYMVYLTLQVQPATFVTYIYRSFAGCSAVFLGGAYIYHYSEKIRITDSRKALMLSSILMMAYVALFAFPYRKTELLLEKVYFSVIILAGIVIVLKDIVIPKSLDMVLGYLSVGIFVSQKLALGCLKIVSTKPALSKVVGWGTNWSILWIIGISAVFSVILYYAVDRPIEMLRNRIRG